ncbi:MAG: MFS transporter [Candidatus Aerophobetes bacterium]
MTNKYRALIMGWGSWVVNYLQRMIVPALLPLIIVTFQVSRSEAGMLMTATFIGYSLSIIPAGYLSDRIGRKIVIVGGIFLYSLTSLLIALSRSPAIMVWLRLGTGIGLGTHIAASNALLSRYFSSDEREGAIGFHESGANIGFVLAFIVVGLLGEQLGWSPIFLITGLIGLLYGVLYWYMVREPVPRTPKRLSFSLREIVGDCRKILVNRSTLLIILSLGILYWGRNGVCTFLPVYLVDSKGFEFTSAALILWIIPAAGIPGKILGGRLCSWLGRSTFLICAFLASSLGVLLLPLAHHDMILWGALILFGFFSNAASPLMYAHTSRLYEDSHTGMALGTVIGIALLISALSPTVTGVIIDGYGYTIAFIIVGAILGLGALTLGKQREEQIVRKMELEKAV